MTDVASIVSGVVDRAKAKITDTATQAIGFAQQILSAHQSVVSAERSGHSQSLTHAVKAGEQWRAWVPLF